MMLKIVKLQHLNAASQRVRRAQHRQVSTVAVRSRVRHSFVDQTNMNASSSYRVWPQRAARVFQLGLSQDSSWLLLKLKVAARLSPFKPTQQWNETNVYLTLAVPLSFIWHTQGNYTRCTYPFPLWSLFMCRFDENIFESFCLVRKETMHRIQELYLFIRHGVNT